MGPELPVLASKITLGISSLLFHPIGKCPPGCGYAYLLIRGRLGGQRWPPTDPRQARCGKNKNPRISSEEITCDATGLQAAKGQREVNRSVFDCWEGVQGRLRELSPRVGAPHKTETICVTLVAACLRVAKVNSQTVSQTRTEAAKLQTELIIKDPCQQPLKATTLLALNEAHFGSSIIAGSGYP